MADETIDNNLKALIHKRGLCKGKLTRFQSFIESSSPNVSEIRRRQARLESAFDEFEEIQSQIELLDLDNELQQTEERESFESLFFSLSAKADDIIQSKTPQSTNIAGDNSPINNQTCESNQQIQVKLPSINLTSFSGNYEDWASFSETFNALIHQNETLSEIQKFHYLRSALKGEAAQVIHSLELVSSNYLVAWSLLETRFENQRITIQNHVRSLFDLPTVDKETASSLRPLLDGVLKHVRALKALKQPTEAWDALLLHIVTSKLNTRLQREWELTTQPDELPKFSQLTAFLQRRCQMLETTSIDTSHKQQNIPKFSKSWSKPKHKTCMLVQSFNCRVCSGKHPIYRCETLLNLPNNQRYQKLGEAGICFNCLKPGHRVSECSHPKGCRLCSKKHNTILHSNERTAHTNTQDTQASNSNNIQATVDQVNCHSSSKCVNTQVLLSTAIVDVIGPRGHTIQCRALLDNGSQSSFLTEAIAQQLCLPRQKQVVTVSGINGNQINSHSSVKVTLRSRISNYSTELNCLVVPKITNQIPSERVEIKKLQIPQTVILADPQFCTPGQIDMLIGQELFFDLLCIGQIRQTGMPTIQKTKLGWVVGGKYCVNNPNSESVCNLSVADKLDNQLKAFWNLEEPTSKIRHLTSEEAGCEKHFIENTVRESDGRYTVSMPFHTDPQKLGDSREIAVRRFMQLEKRLTRNKHLHEQYTDFINEYKNLNHMEKIEEDTQSQPEYFLPHHAVIKPSSSTTKLRVVFDASSKTTSGLSLNDIQMVGPTVQNDIISIFLRFRTHNIVLTADIEKMYRQVNINSSQRDLLKILWRETPSKPLETYRLTTVTYGTASAPYLATRTLVQLAEDEKHSHPKASEIVKRDFYVDDILTGADSEEEAAELKEELITLLSKGKFNLRKWNSNLQGLREQSSSKQQDHSMVTDCDLTVKTLGLWWNPERDQFKFKHSHRVELKNTRQLTKRVILSEIATLFDPLGLVAPVIVRAKMHMQELWKLDLGWDESLPMHIHSEWIKLSGCLNDLNHVIIDRQVTLSDKTIPFELHGFADASEKAYGSAIYLRHEDGRGNIRVSLLCAKSRVAPIKTVSLPRLELCASLLLSELMQRVADALDVPPERITYWTDSTVVLSWLRSEPARWNTFVANRVAKIQEITINGAWRHVRSEHNPADIVSRGSQARCLIKSQLWWFGPSWLATKRCQWPTNLPIDYTTEPPEQRKPKVTALLSTKPENNDTIAYLSKKYSSFTKLTRVVAYCLRFIKNTTLKTTKDNGPLDISELSEARKRILKFVQLQSFPQDLKLLQARKPVATKQLQHLAPFLDESGLIRVGGRLEGSELHYDTRHPIILPKNSIITEMIIREEHLRNLHCGPQTLLYAVRQQYWPINGRNLTRKITHHCIKCFKAKPKIACQLMGELPTSRVSPARCFLHSGVDYCGPFYIKQSRRRGSRLEKAYVCVFVCLSTKAVHLEVVTDLTTDTFLGALRRFVSRRGICVEIQSDNGTTFVGANRELKELQQFLERESSTITDAATKEGIRWRFNPPYSPHMGGLWEAAVKSLKHHLRRVIGNASLTYEEFNTVIVQVEAVLNSRPLTPMSNDPSDLSVLTPAHFLTFGSLTAVPEPSLRLLPEGRLSRWQRVQQLLQHLWARWSSEYLTNLQQRRKWQTPSPDIQVGTLVLMKDDHLPPLSWPTGRVIALHPGKDNRVRVVSLKTSSGTVSRAINKLCPLPLPVEGNNEQ